MGARTPWLTHGNLSPLQNWCIKRRSQSIYLQVLTDKHAPEHYRYRPAPKWGGMAGDSLPHIWQCHAKWGGHQQALGGHPWGRGWGADGVRGCPKRGAWQQQEGVGGAQL